MNFAVATVKNLGRFSVELYTFRMKISGAHSKEEGITQRTLHPHATLTFIIQALSFLFAEVLG